jgi:hypothetical protein
VFHDFGTAAASYIRAGCSAGFCHVPARLCLVFLLLGPLFAADAEPRLAISLDGAARETAGGAALRIDGPHRFVRVNGKVGYQPLSLKTTFRIATDLQRGDAGTMVMWAAPLETLAVVSRMESWASKDPLAQYYNLLGDALPPGDEAQTTFAWQWRSLWHPQMIAKFRAGRPKPDFEPVPRVITEHLPLGEKKWYQFVLTWNHTQHRLRHYVDGILSGATNYAYRADAPRPELYLGNTAMVFGGLEIYDRELTAAEVASMYERADYPKDPAVRARLLDFFTVTPKPAVDWKPAAGWKQVYETSFTRPADLDRWIQQGCLGVPYSMKEKRITPDGLLLETPDEIANESRMYLWSPRSFEGDIAVQFDFRPERESGLALLVVQASGMQREDFIADHPRRTSGGMGTIIADRVRNYHWEFFRKTPDVRADLQTEILVKNPWTRPLGMSCIPDLETGRFHRLLFVQEGAHLRAAIDGHWALDAHDDPWINMGPVFNSGRIGIRLMYQTRMTFRDLKVWNRDTGVEIVR